MNKIQKLTSTVGSTTLMGFLLLAFFLSFIFSIIDYNRTYNQHLKKIETRLNEVQLGFIKSLTNSIWKIDYEQTTIILESILRQEDIEFVSVVKGDKNLFTVGEKVNRSHSISRTFPLVMEFRNKKEHLGDLYVMATTKNLDQVLRFEFWLAVVIEFIKIALYAFCTLIFVKLVITRHLESITRFLGEPNIYSGQKTFSLNRKYELWKKGNDEFDLLEKSINQMIGDFRRELQQRKKTENELVLLNENLEKSVENRTVQLLEATRMGAVGEMAAGVSHEINSPLSVIYTISRRLEKQAEKSDELELNKENLILMSQKITSTVKRIFFITKALQVIGQSGEGESKEVHCLGLIDKTMLAVSEILKSSFGKIDYVVHDIPEKLIIDENTFLQLIYNLIHYRSKSFAGQMDPWLRIEFGSTESEIFVTFYDNGDELSQEDKKSIMDPFSSSGSRSKGSHLFSGTLKSYSDKINAKIVFIEHTKEAFLQLRIPLAEEKR